MSTTIQRIQSTPAATAPVKSGQTAMSVTPSKPDQFIKNAKPTDANSIATGVFDELKKQNISIEDDFKSKYTSHQKQLLATGKYDLNQPKDVNKLIAETTRQLTTAELGKLPKTVQTIFQILLQGPSDIPNLSALKVK